LSEGHTTPFELIDKKVWVAGHKGMVGSALVRRLAHEDCDILTCDRDTVDLGNQAQVEDWVAANVPDAIIIAAAKVGGIKANSTYPADFLYQNLILEANIIHSAHKAGVKKLLFLGSSCIYPRMADQPMREDALLTGPLEPTNEWYAVAKIAGIKLSEAYRQQHGNDFISAMPTNLFGPGDNYDLENSHVPAAMIAKCHAAKMAGDSTIEVWGTGAPMREFMSVDDLADALVFLLIHYSDDTFVNVGSGKEISIKAFAEIVAKIVGFEGDLVFDTSRPDGMPRKMMDSSALIGLGWTPQIGLYEGLEQAYVWYLENIA
jgi:GDP-L-fucose synthase